MLTDEDFKRKLGNFTHTNFIPETAKAVTSTSQGLLIVWENESDLKNKTAREPSDTFCKKATKLVPIHERPITFMTITRCQIKFYFDMPCVSKSTEYCIVTGDMGGHIKFFDSNFLLVYWYQEINAGPVKHISFARRSILDDDDMKTWRSSAILQNTEYPECSTIPAEKFVVEDFVVSTAHANLVAVTVDGGTLQIIMQDNHDVVTGLSVHPNLSVVGLKNFGSTQPIQTCKFDPKGSVLALGFVDGQVHIVDSITLESVTKNPFVFGKGSIDHIAFERNAEFCAYSDASFAITLLHYNEENKTEYAWVYVGRVRAHFAKITDLLFWKPTASTKCRLFTLGEDKIMAEYDIYQSTLHNIPLLARYHVEQLSKPLCMCGLPNYYKEDFLCLFSSSSKLKLFNASSMMCRKTVMVHPLGIQVSQLCPLPEDEISEARFFAFISEERLGLIMLPLDGDPLKTTNLIAHPSGPRGVGRASALATSADGRYVFTAGGPDTAVHMWKVNAKLLEEEVAAKQDLRQRFYSMISPELLHDMKDYFYYSMLRTQGIKCLDTRQTSMTIPIDEISYVMRAIGFYPTEMEVDSMINEVKYSTFYETGNYVEDIALDTFIQRLVEKAYLCVDYHLLTFALLTRLQVYCNHRPFERVCRQQIERAFNTLCGLHTSEHDQNSALFCSAHSPVEQKCSISTVNLIEYLLSLGEPIDETELVDCLAIQMGVLPEGGRSEAAVPVNDEEVVEKMKSRLPEDFDVESFIKNVLGMDFCDQIKNIPCRISLKLRSETSSRENSAVQTE